MTQRLCIVPVVGLSFTETKFPLFCSLAKNDRLRSQDVEEQRDTEGFMTGHRMVTSLRRCEMLAVTASHINPPYRRYHLP